MSYENLSIGQFCGGNDFYELFPPLNPFSLNEHRDFHCKENSTDSESRVEYFCDTYDKT